MIDHSQVKLGKKPFTTDHRDLRLAKYLDKGRILDSEIIPAAFDWISMSGLAYDTDVLGNDTWGCCVFAGIAHKLRRIGLMTGNANLSSINADDVVKTYLTLTGGADKGFEIREALKIMRKTGLFGATIDGFALVNMGDPDERRIAAWLGCGTLNGYQLPLASQNQVDAQGRQLWDVPAGGWPTGKGPGSWGGHCEDNHAEDNGLGTDNSWGDPTVRTDAWMRACCDEGYLMLVPQWGAAGKAPNGFAYADLLSDIQARGGE
jgi:hypothetical protein